jgi:hypothetical protein
LTFLGGIVAGASLMFISLNVFEIDIKTATDKELSNRLESIPVEEICKAISSGNQILGEDHVVVWNDEKRYIVGGWTIQKSGVPNAEIPSSI